MAITAEQEQKLRELMNVFLEENAKINLSAFRTEETCWVGNILDSISFLEVSPSPAGEGAGGWGKILDLGTGGGFPLLPLAMCLPDIQFTGVDSTQKKVNAVKRIADRLQIKNVTLLCGRAEELARDRSLREQFDAVLARGVAEISVLLEYCSPFAKVGGKVVLWKSLTIEDELKDSARAQKELCSELVDQHRYALPEDFGERQLLVFEKKAAVQSKYPRTVGVPKKQPIGVLE